MSFFSDLFDPTTQQGAVVQGGIQNGVEGAVSAIPGGGTAIGIFKALEGLFSGGGGRQSNWDILNPAGHVWVTKYGPELWWNQFTGNQNDLEGSIYPSYAIWLRKRGENAHYPEDVTFPAWLQKTTGYSKVMDIPEEVWSGAPSTPRDYKRGESGDAGLPKWIWYVLGGLILVVVAFSLVSKPEKKKRTKVRKPKVRRRTLRP